MSATSQKHNDVMQLCQRPPHRFDAGEKEMLLTFLNRQRQTAICKLAGLSDDDLRRKHQPSGMSPLGILKHLGIVEQTWFQYDFLGDEAAAPKSEEEWNSYWEISPDESTADVIGYYEAQVARANEITAAASLDDRGADPSNEAPGLTLRWILGHMIEETARHNGHLDLIREGIDGQIGS